MKLLSILTDHNMQEKILYPNPSFPFGVWIDTYSLMRNHQLDCHWHCDFELGVMISGRLNYSLSGTDFPLNAGEAVFVNANTLHTAKLSPESEDAVMAVITFHPTVFDRNTQSPFYQKYFQTILDQNIKGCKIKPVTAPGAEIAGGLRKICEMWEQSEDYEILCLAGMGVVWHHVLCYLRQNNGAIILRNPASKYEEKMKCFISYIQTHYAESISIDDLAAYAHISRSECFRCFRQMMRKTPVEYINEYRLSCAASLLTSTNDSITEICGKCGFIHSSYFGKLFHEAYGKTPLEYRREQKSSSLAVF
ncbi:MAG: AraC family transcriptional regulator [Lachnospiraceae bacterium]|nr:AraC family transcriptional regulator [Lachnospiraceae bacterium]